MSYAGPAVIAGTVVHVRCSGRWEPFDGRYHWVGRIRPDPRIAALVRSGRRDVRVAIGDRVVAARLGEIDPWGGVRVTGAGRPPWPTDPSGPGRPDGPDGAAPE